MPPGRAATPPHAAGEAPAEPVQHRHRLDLAEGRPAADGVPLLYAVEEAGPRNSPLRGPARQYAGDIRPFKGFADDLRQGYPHRGNLPDHAPPESRRGGVSPRDPLRQRHAGIRQPQQGRPGLQGAGRRDNAIARMHDQDQYPRRRRRPDEYFRHDRERRPNPEIRPRRPPPACRDHPLRVAVGGDPGPARPDAAPRLLPPSQAAGAPHLRNRPKVLRQAGRVADQPKHPARKMRFKEQP